MGILVGNQQQKKSTTANANAGPDDGFLVKAPILKEMEALNGQLISLYQQIPPPSSMSTFKGIMNESFFGVGKLFGNKTNFEELCELYSRLQKSFGAATRECDEATYSLKGGDMQAFSMHFASATKLYQNYLGDVANYKARFEQFDLGFSQFFSRVLDSATLFSMPFGVGAIAGTVRTLGSSGFKALVASVFTKEAIKNAFKASAGVSALFTGVQAYDVHKVNSAMDRFSEDPLREIASLKGRLNLIRSQVNSGSGKDKEKLLESLDRSLKDLDGAEQLLKGARTEFSVGQAAGFFLQSFATCMVFEVGGRVLFSGAKTAKTTKTKTKGEPKGKETNVQSPNSGLVKNKIYKDFDSEGAKGFLLRHNKGEPVPAELMLPANNLVEFKTALSMTEGFLPEGIRGLAENKIVAFSVPEGLSLNPGELPGGFFIKGSNIVCGAYKPGSEQLFTNAKIATWYHELLHYFSDRSRAAGYLLVEGGENMRANRTWLDEGLTEYFAQSECRRNGLDKTSISYLSEVTLGYLLKDAAGSGAIKEAYFTGNLNPVRDAFNQKWGKSGISFEGMLKLKDADAVLQYLQKAPELEEFIFNFWTSKPGIFKQPEHFL